MHRDRYNIETVNETLFSIESFHDQQLYIAMLQIKSTVTKTKTEMK